MDQIIKGILRRPGDQVECATCTVRIDPDKVPSMSDDDVSPKLPDGEYDIEVNGLHLSAIRENGQWAQRQY